MKFKEWNEIAELIGIAAVVASLIFVGLQMKQSQEIANAERRMMRNANNIAMNNAISEHADIWVKGLSDQELNETEAVIFKNLLFNCDAFVFSNWRAAQNLGSGVGATSRVAVYAAFLYENPGARRVMESDQDWLDDYLAQLMPGVEVGADYLQLVDEYLNELDQLQEWPVHRAVVKQVSACGR